MNCFKLFSLYLSIKPRNGESVSNSSDCPTWDVALCCFSWSCKRPFSWDVKGKVKYLEVWDFYFRKCKTCHRPWYEYVCKALCASRYMSDISPHLCPVQEVIQCIFWACSLCSSLTVFNHVYTEHKNFEPSSWFNAFYFLSLCCIGMCCIAETATVTLFTVPIKHWDLWIWKQQRTLWALLACRLIKR